MIMKSIFCLVMLLLSINYLVAQQKQSFKLSGNLQVGLLKGQANDALQVQVVGGVQYTTWFAGIGIAMDDYYKRTAPVFLSIRKNILRKIETPYLYADIGYSLPWVNEAPTEWQRSEFNKGVYLDAGVGYILAVSGSVAFKVSVGYSQKELHESRYFRSYIYRDFPPYDTELGPERIEYFDYSLRRLSIRIGLTF
jgi:hypothetical protein